MKAKEKTVEQYQSGFTHEKSIVDAIDVMRQVHGEQDQVQ